MQCWSSDDDEDETSNHRHVVPVNDVIEHEIDRANCICGPREGHVTREDGSIGYLYIHNSLDGREFYRR